MSENEAIRRLQEAQALQQTLTAIST